MLRTREETIKILRKRSCPEKPVLIIGGGINGAGLYRDLALQGVKAILVDKGDFSSGTSAASSRLIHGGLRYLETGEFDLVKESVIERNALLANAPHLVRPLPVLVPAFSYFGGLFSAGLRFLKLKKTPGPKGIVAVKLGLTFFDRFGRANQKMPNHQIFSAKTGRKMVPGLSPSVCAVAQYYDTRLVCPERLTLELIEDSEQDCDSSMALNYMEVIGAADDTVTLRDGLTGERINITPSLVVNCAGIWADKVNDALGFQTQFVGGTQGAHLVLDRPDVVQQLDGRMLYFETEDFRACLIYALNERHVLMGTTDIRADNPDEAVCQQKEIDYILSVTEKMLPEANFRQEDIIFTYAGIRPLPASSEETTGAISRDHSFQMCRAQGNRKFDTLVLVGGKLTTYRACAEQLAERVLGHVGGERKKSTLSLAIGGGKGFAAEDQNQLRQEINALLAHSELVEVLLDRYGSRAVHLAKALANESLECISGTGYYRSEIRWIVENERVAHLSDVLLRRSRLPFESPLSQDILMEIGAICAQCLSWDAARLEQEIENTRQVLESRHLTIV